MGIVMRILCLFLLVAIFASPVLADDDVERQAQEIAREAEGWLEKAQHVFTLNCEEQQAIRGAYCSGDYKPGEAPDISSYDSLAEDSARRILDEVKKLRDEYDDLKKRVDDIKDEEGADEAVESFEELEEAREKLEGLEKIGHLRGSRNPKIQTWINYGIEQHDRMYNDHNCEFKDYYLEGVALRPDCISMSECGVYEFKPKGSRNDGSGQLGRYVAHIMDMVDEIIDREQDGSLSQDDLKDNPLGLALWNNRCLDPDGDVTFDARVFEYERCDEHSFECEKP